MKRTFHASFGPTVVLVLMTSPRRKIRAREQQQQQQQQQNGVCSFEDKFVVEGGITM
jgi:hypothetical protein